VRGGGVWGGGRGGGGGGAGRGGGGGVRPMCPYTRDQHGAGQPDPARPDPGRAISKIFVPGMDRAGP